MVDRRIPRTNVLEVDEILEVYIYPQNQETASKEYVDDQDALLQSQINDNKTDIAAPSNKDYVDTQDALKVTKSGDVMTGDLSFQEDLTEFEVRHQTPFHWFGPRRQPTHLY